jgi:hypothetical protein
MEYKLLCCKDEKGISGKARIGSTSTMDVVDEGLKVRLTPLQAMRTGSNGRTKAAFEDGVDGFTLPALPVEAI